jgi:hypothetical protein
MIHLISFKVDRDTMKAGYSPEWYGRFRLKLLLIHLAITITFGLIYHQYKDEIQRRSHSRLTDMREALKLPDKEFILTAIEKDLGVE